MAKSPLILAALAKDACRHLDFAQVKSLNAGTDGTFDTALLTSTTGEHYVVRIANTQSAGTEQEVELQSLRAIGAAGRANLPFKITNLVGETRDEKGARALVFDFVYGNPIHVDEVSGESELARNIGLAIAAIQKLPLSVVENANLPEFTPEELVRARTADLDRFASTGKVPSVLLSRWEAVLEDVNIFRFQPTIVHGALNGDTVLEEGGREVVGVLAWGNLKISDPAIDLAWVFGVQNDPLADAVLAAYSASRSVTDAGLRQRAILYSEFDLARWLLHGLNKGDQLIIDDAIEMLTKRAEDVESGVVGRLTAAPIHEPEFVPFMDSPIEIVDTVYTDFNDPSQSFEIIEINELDSTEDPEVTSGLATDDDDEFEIVKIDESLATAEIQVVDDKTKPIELPQKTDNELF